jgi:hypothetical protein
MQKLLRKCGAQHSLVMMDEVDEGEDKDEGESACKEVGDIIEDWHWRGGSKDWWNAAGWVYTSWGRDWEGQSIVLEVWRSYKRNLNVSSNMSGKMSLHQKRTNR